MAVEDDSQDDIKVVRKIYAIPNVQVVGHFSKVFKPCVFYNVVKCPVSGQITQVKKKLFDVLTHLSSDTPNLLSYS